ncbi:MAG TPA: VCBS repeat-containing protein [Chitinophagaceae bacterium]|nr:VCBS repeat-containing protein [Chitinophagaceae bacterium]
MGKKLGLSYYEGIYFSNTDENPYPSTDSVQSHIPYEDWQKIVQYYIEEAPSQQPLQNRPPLRAFTDRFTVSEGILKDVDPTTVYVKIDPGNQRIYTCSVFDSVFAVFDPRLNLLQKQNIHRTMVDMWFNNDLHLPGARNGVLTNIGILYPNDARNGSIDSFHLTKNGKLESLKTLSAEIPRPVQTTIADLDGDSKKDYLVCGFGNNKGEFYYLKKTDSTPVKKPLILLPGAVKAYVDDFNKDGLPDIVVLMAQAQEGIFMFLNKGNGNFEKKELLRFPPIYGSSYFEMEDVNGDGLKDIIYTCGDNLDFTADVLKNYHGVYIFLNKGNNKFEQLYFFPIHGCYKAIARDFDKDGDMDIITISYFPDYKNQLEESIVYLENKGSFNFTAYTVQEYDSGNWISMDAADVDGDGDDDIVIGSLWLISSSWKMKFKSKQKDKPAFLLLVNRTKDN